MAYFKNGLSFISISYFRYCIYLIDIILYLYTSSKKFMSSGSSNIHIYTQIYICEKRESKESYKSHFFKVTYYIHILYREPYKQRGWWTQNNLKRLANVAFNLGCTRIEKKLNKLQH